MNQRDILYNQLLEKGAIQISLEVQQRQTHTKNFLFNENLQKSMNHFFQSQIKNKQRNLKNIPIKIHKSKRSIDKEFSDLEVSSSKKTRYLKDNSFSQMKQNNNHLVVSSSQTVKNGQSEQQQENKNNQHIPKQQFSRNNYAISQVLNNLESRMRSLTQVKKQQSLMLSFDQGNNQKLKNIFQLNKQEQQNSLRNNINILLSNSYEKIDNNDPIKQVIKLKNSQQYKSNNDSLSNQKDEQIKSTFQNKGFNKIPLYRKFILKLEQQKKSNDMIIESSNQQALVGQSKCLDSLNNKNPFQRINLPQVTKMKISQSQREQNTVVRYNKSMERNLMNITTIQIPKFKFFQTNTSKFPFQNEQIKVNQNQSFYNFNQTNELSVFKMRKNLLPKYQFKRDEGEIKIDGSNENQNIKTVESLSPWKASSKDIDIISPPLESIWHDRKKKQLSFPKLIKIQNDREQKISEDEEALEEEQLNEIRLLKKLYN